MTNERERTGDWQGKEWEGDVPDRDDVTRDPAETGDRWVKTQVRPDLGEGDMPAQDPDTMPEGETGLSGDRHAPSEQHFARGQSRDPS